MWRQTIDYLVFVFDMLKDVSKITDYSKMRSLHHVTSYFWWGGGIEIEHLHRVGGIETEKTLLL